MAAQKDSVLQSAISLAKQAIEFDNLVRSSLCMWLCVHMRQ